jgi:hypothetical protein
MAIGSPMHHVRNAAREASPWVKLLARAGFASRAVLSCTIGILAALAAFGDGDGKTTDSKGALRELHDRPFGSFGQVLLAIVAVGLFGYALWLFVQAFLDPERPARPNKGRPFMRVGWFTAGALHVTLGIYAIGLVTGKALGSAEDGTKSWTARLLGWDGIGPALVGGLGLIVIGLAMWDLYKAVKAKLDRHLDLSRLGRATRKVVVDLARFGLAARAVVFALIGSALVMAAVRANPYEAKGLGETLARIRGWSFGWVLLAIVAIGFIAYGVYQLVEARYRRIHAC